MRININKNSLGGAGSRKPSRFLIELKSEIEELGERVENKEKEVLKSGLFSFFSRFFIGFKKRIKPKTKVFYLNQKHKNSFEKILFYPILKIAFKLFDLFVWLAHFILRFFYYLSIFSFKKLKAMVSYQGEKKKIGKKLESDWGRDNFIPKEMVLGKTRKKSKKNTNQKSFFLFSYRKFPRLTFSFKEFRRVFYFALVLLAIALPLAFYNSYLDFDFEGLKGRVLGASEDAVFNLSSASHGVGDLDFVSSQGAFLKAGDDLLSIKIEMEKMNSILFFLASFVPNKKIKLAAEGRDIVDIGILGSKIGDNFSIALNSLSNKNIKLTSRLDIFNSSIKEAFDNITELEKLLNGIDINLFPDEYRDKISLLKKSITSSKPALKELSDLCDKLIIFLGGEQDKRYLFVFQNNSELRASGGFIGSFALVDFSQGEIKNIEVPGGGSYDTEGGLKEFLVAPEPLHLVNPLWHFWDANWWPDFPKTARKLMWFYERSGGPSVDGVISFTPDVIENILSVIGPIDMSENYGIVIDNNNFWNETQKLAEQKPDKTKKPKKIIGDLMNRMIEELPNRINKNNIIDLTKAVLNTLNEKQILFYFEDDNLENKVKEYAWAGEVEKTISDYLMIVNTNIAGAKSDRVIEQKVNHNVEIKENGDIFDTLLIERKHNGIKGDEFTGVRNNSWMRIYVPLGSELIEAYGFWPIDENLFEKPDDSWEIDEDLIAEREAYIDKESWTKIYEDSGKTVFANWSWVDPGETVTISLKYKLPFKIDFSKKNDLSFYKKIGSYFGREKNKLIPYSLMIQKQAGTKNDLFSSNLELNGEQKIVWAYNLGSLWNDKGWNLRAYLNRDKYWAVLLEK